MANICVKLRQREKNKYRKMLSTDECVYNPEDIQISSSTPFVAGAVLEDGEWFSVKEASKQDYKIDLLIETYNSIDFDALSRTEFANVDYLFVVDDKLTYFQNISKARLVSKKSVLCIGETFEFKDDRQEIIINSVPDAIYDKEKDILFFRRLEAITSIFRGIDMLYKEATAEETTDFLSNEFINLKDGYDASKVKTANRKRIALAKKTLEGLDSESKKNIFKYIGDYCPDLQATEESFDVGTEDELKLLLYGIEQRFYTTVVGEEKRIANSVVPLEM